MMDANTVGSQWSPVDRVQSDRVAARSAHLPELFRIPTMSASVDGDELSISHHLCAVKRKLHGITSSGRYVRGS